jgi:hypothetical protein
MSITIAQIALPNERQATVEIRGPGTIRYVAMGAVKSGLVDLPGARSSRMMEHVVLFAEVDPKAPPQRRTFLCLTPGIEFEPNPGVRMEWCGIAFSQGGSVVFVYELVIPAEAAPRFNAPPPVPPEVWRERDRMLGGAPNDTGEQHRVPPHEFEAYDVPSKPLLSEYCQHCAAPRTAHAVAVDETRSRLESPVLDE